MSQTPDTGHPGHSGPVTVSIVRHIAPEHAGQMVAWVRAGSLLAERRTGIEG
ncbi:MAG: hypothetical protein ABIN79_05585 [Marmoricola sp.]